MTSLPVGSAQAVRYCVTYHHHLLGEEVLSGSLLVSAAGGINRCWTGVVVRVVSSSVVVSVVHNIIVPFLIAPLVASLLSLL